MYSRKKVRELERELRSASEAAEDAEARAISAERHYRSLQETVKVSLSSVESNLLADLS